MVVFLGPVEVGVVSVEAEQVHVTQAVEVVVLAAQHSGRVAEPQAAAESDEPVRQLADLPQWPPLAVVRIEVAENDLTALTAGLQPGDAQDLRDRAHVRNPGHPEPRGDDPGCLRCGEEAAASVVAQPAHVQLVCAEPGQTEGEALQVEGVVAVLPHDSLVVVLREDHRLGRNRAGDRPGCCR